MRVLVTGAGGVIGSAVAEHLLAGGHEVVGLGRRLTPRLRRLSAAISADLGRPGVVRRLIDEQPRCEAIVHAAASLDHGLLAGEVALSNCLGTQQALALAAGWHSRRFVFISSLPLIGAPRELPITEAHPVAPPTAYHASKLFGEQLVALASREGVSGVSLRVTSPAAPGLPKERILPAFVGRALADQPLEVAGEGGREQDFVDVRDIAAAVAAALSAPVEGVVNVASGSPVSNLELARRCVAILGSGSEVRRSGREDPQEQVRWRVSIERARRELGWEPQHTLEESIRFCATGETVSA